MVVPLVHPAAGDYTQIGTAQQFADINKGLIVQGLEGWSEENKDEVWWRVKRHFKSRLGNESLGEIKELLRNLYFVMPGGSGDCASRDL